MKRRRFIVVVNDASPNQQNTITAFFKNSNFAYWHWFKDLWLVIDTTGTWDAGVLRDKLNELFPPLHKFVSQVHSGKTWGINGNPESFPWLHDEWARE